jgi:hypothetical protein
MTESGINSFEEFLLFYAFFGFVLALVWGILEAGIVLSGVPVSEERSLLAARLRISRWMAPLGLLHIGFAVIAWDATRGRPDHDGPVDGARRASIEARFCFGLSVAVLALLIAPHVDGVSAVPVVGDIGTRAPWE